MAVLTPQSQPLVSVAGVTPITSLPKKVLGAALGAVLSGLVLIDSKAKAIVVSVRGFDYDVTTFTGSFPDNPAKFQTEANGGNMPWWNHRSLTLEFTAAVGASLGVVIPNCRNPAGCGPIFALDYSSQGFNMMWQGNGWVLRDYIVNPWDTTSDSGRYPYSYDSYSQRLPDSVYATAYDFQDSIVIGPSLVFGSGPWAQAALIGPTGGGSSGGGSTSGGTASVPGPLPILGVAAAFGFSRKLRKRIKLHRGTSAVPTPPGA